MPGTGADHLYIAGLQTALIAETVRMRHDTRPNVSHNLNIGMAMHAKPVWGATSSSFSTYRLPTGLCAGLPKRPMAK